MHTIYNQNKEFSVKNNGKFNTMEQIKRIKQMERNLDRASQAVMRLSKALDAYAGAQAAINNLSAYYGSEEWKKDFEDDERGLLPQDLKRGVLSEDGIWNVLTDCHALNIRMQEIITDQEVKSKL